jgi:hypothetical protein
MNRLFQSMALCAALLVLLLQQSAHAQLIPFGLQTDSITALACERNDYAGGPVPPVVFAGTVRGQVFGNSIFGKASGWTDIGSPGASITALTVQHWGVGPRDGLHLLAGGLDANGKLPFLTRRTLLLNGAPQTDWESADSGLDLASLRQINALDAWYYSGHEPPGHTLLGAEGGGWLGESAGRFWTPLSFDEGPVSVTRFDVPRRWFGETVWAAGHINGDPVACVSTDGGATWQTRYRISRALVEYAPRIAVNARSMDSVYFLAFDVVYLTADSGASWNAMNSALSEGHATAISVDPAQPEHVYIAGQTYDTGALFLLHSSNGGTTWESVYNPGPDFIAGATDLLFIDTEDPLVPGKQERALLIGTAGTGVWKFSPETPTAVDGLHSVPSSIGIVVAPQPVTAAATLTFTLPSSTCADVMIYDMLGRTIAVCASGRFEAGTHRASFHSSDLAPGTYIANVRTSAGIASRIFTVTR